MSGQTLNMSGLNLVVEERFREELSSMNCVMVWWYGVPRSCLKGSASRQCSEPQMIVKVVYLVKDIAIYMWPIRIV